MVRLMNMIIRIKILHIRGILISANFPISFNIYSSVHKETKIFELNFSVMSQKTICVLLSGYYNLV